MMAVMKGGGNMNQVGLVGRLTKDPVLRQLSDRKATVNFVLAINRNFRNSQGTVEADYLSCVAWGRLAERIATYCGKGSLVGINGRLQTGSYVNKENVKVYNTEVVVEDVRFYALKQREGQPAAGAQHKMQNEVDVAAHFVLPSEDEEAGAKPVTL